jgi:hypothetical protein
LELHSLLLGLREHTGALLGAAGGLRLLGGHAGLVGLLVEAYDLVGLRGLLGLLHCELLLLLHHLRLHLHLLQLLLAHSNLGSD